MNVIKRILDSKKVALLMVPVVANFVLDAFGIDITAVSVLILNAAFAGLALAQFVLDLRFGSSSDGTLTKA